MNNLKLICIIILGLPCTTFMVTLEKTLDCLNTLYFYAEGKVTKYRDFLIRLFNYKEEVDD